MIYLIAGLGLFVVAGIFLAVSPASPLFAWMERDTRSTLYELNRIKCQYCGCKNGTRPDECVFCGAPLQPNPVQHW